MLLLLMYLAACPAPKVVKKTTAPWTQQDELALTTAGKRCKVHFPKSPCLKSFIRVEHGTYRAICGRAK